jgi:hypothetical protein
MEFKEVLFNLDGERGIVPRNVNLEKFDAIGQCFPDDVGTEVEPRDIERSLATKATHLAEKLIHESPFDPNADFISLNLASRPGQNPYVLGGLNTPFSQIAYSFRSPHVIRDKYNLIRYRNEAGHYSYAFGCVDGPAFVGICWVSNSDEVGHVVHIDKSGENNYINPPEYSDGAFCDDTLYYLDLLERSFNYDRGTHTIIVTPGRRNKVVKKGLFASVVNTAGKVINGY